MPSLYRFAPWSELCEGTGEDGPYHYETYTVACTHADGRRWLYTGPAEIPTAERARQLADLMARRVAQGGPWWPKDDWWVVGPVVYGSAQYVATGGDRGNHGHLEPELLASNPTDAEHAAREREALTAPKRKI